MFNKNLVALAAPVMLHMEDGGATSQNTLINRLLKIPEFWEQVKYHVSKYEVENYWKKQPTSVSGLNWHAHKHISDTQTCLWTYANMDTYTFIYNIAHVHILKLAGYWLYLIFSVGLHFSLKSVYMCMNNLYVQI